MAFRIARVFRVPLDDVFQYPETERRPSMKAIAQTVYGPADVLWLREVPTRRPAPDEVLVEVRAAGVDPGVWIIMTGRPYAARAAVRPAPAQGRRSAGGRGRRGRGGRRRV